MGIRLFSTDSYDRAAPPPAPNPNPARYEILDHRAIGKMLLVKIRYPDCTTYEGRKLLVYWDVTLEQLKAQSMIDPHFSDKAGYVSPVARFEPTERGWRMANEFARAWVYTP